MLYRRKTICSRAQSWWYGGNVCSSGRSAQKKSIWSSVPRNTVHNCSTKDLPVHLTVIYATTIVLLGFILIAILERAGVSPGWAKLLALTSGIALLYVFIKSQRYAQRLLPRFDIPQIDPEKLLIVRTRGDEASSLLLFAQFIGQAGMLIVSWLMSRHNRLRSAIGRWANKKSLVCGWLIGGTAISFGLFSLLIFPIEMKGLLPVWLAALIMLVSIMILIGTPLLILLGQRAWVEGIAALALPAVLWPIAALVSMILLPSLGGKWPFLHSA